MSTLRGSLPFGSEFSPNQIVLARALEIAHDHQGDPKAFEAAILAEYFSDHAKGSAAGEEKEYNKGKLANNCKLGMIAYGILDRTASFTPFGQALYDIRADEPLLYETLARHILLNLHGMSFVQCIQEMLTTGHAVNLTTLRGGLADRGVDYPSGGKHPSIMRLWLEKAGVFTSLWQVDSIRLRSILGTEPSEFAVLARFTSEQRAFIMALANTGIKTPQPSNEIARLAEASYGVRFPEKNLPKAVLVPLEEAGYIEATKTTGGRGAKPLDVAPTEKLQIEIVGPLLDQLKGQNDPKLRELLTRPLEEILDDIEATKDKSDPASRYTAGLALEALAFRLMRLLGMDYVATRFRGQHTGGAEVDLIFESARLVYSRWQIQCKNTSRVSLDDVAKEVGLTHFLKSNVIVVVTTGQIGSEARRYSNKIMRDTNLCIVMIDRTDLSAIGKNASYIVNTFRREAEHAMTLKKFEGLDGAIS